MADTAKSLVIVESPAKARTVGKFLGNKFIVKASVGHIRDLPSNRMGVNIENDFEPRYVIPEKKKPVVRELKAAVKEADTVFLATDPDREGEAISWHLQHALRVPKKTPVKRVEFHEITKDAIDHAFSHPREIDMNLVNAQQARRILDRLVGYTLSPLLRRKVTKKGLSAGRVQSVAVRLVVEREREIQAFTPVEFWSIDAEMAKHATKGKAKKSDEFRAVLQQINGEKFEIHSRVEAQRIVDDLQGATYAIQEVRKREMQRNPAAPFTTSTMQQEASRKLNYTAKRTMAVAQRLYEGLTIGEEGSVGLITYMRTDSTNLAASAQSEARDFISGKYGQDYLPEQPRVYKTKSKGAQEAHEAIRPTSVKREPEAIKEYLQSDEYKLYRLIWQRTVASQMASAVFDTTSVDIVATGASGTTYLFRATGSTVKFPGFLIVYSEGQDEGEQQDETESNRKTLPPLEKDEPIELRTILPEQHFTQPPPRYTEATLVKALEENGIGRPSTYAPTLSTIQDRGYVERIDKRLQPTEIGFLINDLLVKHFPNIMDVNFTASMEEDLDEIAQGDEEWVPMLHEFFEPFRHTLDEAEKNMETIELKPEPTGDMCEKCGRPLLFKHGRFGKFIACSGYPECRNTKPIMIKIGVHCPQCETGEIVERKTRRKRIFYSCNRYPDCEFATWNRPVPLKCPECGSLMVDAGKKGVMCNNKECGNVIPGEEAAPLIAALQAETQQEPAVAQEAVS